jgi:hypothetical protein
VGVSPVLPAAGERLWRVFAEVSSTRQIGMSANPISMADWYAYSVLMQEPLSPSDMRVLLPLDAAFLAALTETPNGSPLPRA